MWFSLLHWHSWLLISWCACKLRSTVGNDYPSWPIFLDIFGKEHTEKTPKHTKQQRNPPKHSKTINRVTTPPVHQLSYAEVSRRMPRFSCCLPCFGRRHRGIWDRRVDVVVLKGLLGMFVSSLLDQFQDNNFWELQNYSDIYCLSNINIHFGTGTLVICYNRLLWFPKVDHATKQPLHVSWHDKTRSSLHHMFESLQLQAVVVAYDQDILILRYAVLYVTRKYVNCLAWIPYMADKQINTQIFTCVK